MSGDIMFDCWRERLERREECKVELSNCDWMVI